MAKLGGMSSSAVAALCVGLAHGAPAVPGASAPQPLQAVSEAHLVPAEYHHDSQVDVDYGAEFAGTHLVGTTVNFSWSEHVVTGLTRSACAPLYASIDRHTYWFKEAADSQQELEKLFLRNVSTLLCANPEQSDDEYTTILHSMLQLVRDAINRHVHSAFWVKATCAYLDDNCFDVTKLYASYYYMPNANRSGLCTPKNDVAGMDSCLGAVLTHEKYNLAEGNFFLNMSYQMLERGAEFCLDPDLESILATLTTELQARLDYHSGNHAFDELADSHGRLLCTLPDEDEDTYLNAYNAMIDNIDRVTASAVTGSTTCTIDDESFDRMLWMKSNPPDVDDLITMVEGNTRITVTAAHEAAHAVLVDGRSCLDPATGLKDDERSQTLREAHPNYVPTFQVSPRVNFFAIPTVYHKLAPACLAVPAPTGPGFDTSHLPDTVPDDMVATASTLANYTGVCLGANRIRSGRR